MTAEKFLRRASFRQQFGFRHRPWQNRYCIPDLTTAMNLDDITSVFGEPLRRGKSVSDIIFVARQCMHTRLLNGAKHQYVDSPFFEKCNDGIGFLQESVRQHLIHPLLCFGERQTIHDNRPRSRQVDFAAVQHLNLKRLDLAFYDQIGNGDFQTIADTEPINRGCGTHEIRIIQWCSRGSQWPAKFVRKRSGLNSV
jgi:hypothetical protein